MTTDVRPARVGIVGCGDVTNLYLPGCARFESIEVATCADLDAERAAALSARGGFPAVPVGTLLGDPSIEIVLVLTPPAAHAAISRAAIAAGKHVYTEKPLAVTREDAAAILSESDAADVRVGAAPDTFLGGGLQTARAVLDEGAIGTPIAATGTVTHLGPEGWHPNPGIFYAAGGGAPARCRSLLRHGTGQPARPDRRRVGGRARDRLRTADQPRAARRHHRHRRGADDGRCDPRVRFGRGRRI